jgi:hypothetical protein
MKIFATEGTENTERIKMNGYYILVWSVRILMFVSLFFIPLVYCVYKGDFKKGFRFTWIIWIIVLFVNGMFVPYFAELTAKATGEPVDYDGFGFILGFFVGWLPGLIIAPIGCFIHNLIKK